MSRFRGLVMALILAGIVGLVAILRTTAGAANGAAEAGSVVTLHSGTATPSPAAVTPSAIPLPAIVQSAAPVILPPNTVTAVSADEIQTIVPINTPSGDSSTAVAGWNPPAMGVPIAHNPFDHFWFIRPVAAKYRNFELADYPYGSNGAENDLRIHHGIDLPNPIGVEVMAAGDGTVIIAQKGFVNEYETITSYGNVIVIDHDFGYNGQHLYTLYAHLSAILVQKGQHVAAGERSGLIGNTGQVTGPHVHFEVRVGLDTYASTRNPILWMRPLPGTGAVAGLVQDRAGNPVHSVNVTLLQDNDTQDYVQDTETYGRDSHPPVNSDDQLHENWAMGDLKAGKYLVTATAGGLYFLRHITITDGHLTFVVFGGP